MQRRSHQLESIERRRRDKYLENPVSKRAHLEVYATEHPELKRDVYFITRHPTTKDNE